MSQVINRLNRFRVATEKERPTNGGEKMSGKSLDIFFVAVVVCVALLRRFQFRGVSG